MFYIGWLMVQAMISYLHINTFINTQNLDSPMLYLYISAIVKVFQ